MCKLNNFLVHCDCLNYSYKNNNYFADVKETTAIMSNITAVDMKIVYVLKVLILLRVGRGRVRVGL